MSDAAMRRARLRRKVAVIRYRLAVRIGGWPLQEAEAELSSLEAAVRSLLTAQGRMLDDWAEANEPRRRELWRRLHAEADRVQDVLDGDYSPSPSPVSAATGETGEEGSR